MTVETTVCPAVSGDGKPCSNDEYHTGAHSWDKQTVQKEARFERLTDALDGKRGLDQRSMVAAFREPATPGLYAWGSDYTKTSLVLPAGLTYEQWEQIGGQIGKFIRSWRFWAGDWWRYGEHAYGEMSSQASDVLGVDYQTLRNCAWVAGRIEPSRRRDNLTWSHHEAVAGVKDERERYRLLDEAAEAEVTPTTKELRAKAKGPPPLPTPGSKSPLAQPLLRFCPPEWSTAQIVAAILRVCFPDASTALDTTYGHGAFWDGSAHVEVTGSDIEPGRSPHGTADFRNLPYDDEAFDVVVFDPPHLADGGEDSIMAQRYGTYGGDELEDAVTRGAREAWRVARLGVVVKVTDAVHGQQYVPMSDWVRGSLGDHWMVPYEVVHQVRERALEDPKWCEQLSARNNGATYLAFRKDGPLHVARGQSVGS